MDRNSSAGKLLENIARLVAHLDTMRCEKLSEAVITIVSEIKMDVRRHKRRATKRPNENGTDRQAVTWTLAEG